MSKSLFIRNVTIPYSKNNKYLKDIYIENGVIFSINNCKPDPSSLIIDADGLMAIPGIIDIHTHGILDIRTEECDLNEYAEVEASFGATTFLPSFFNPPKKIAESMKRHLSENNYLKNLPQIPGFRIESPYLVKIGGGNSKDFTPISDDVTNMLFEAGSGFIKIWDISPELPGALETISFLTSKGIICSLAHSGASIEQARNAVNKGLKLVTHLYDTFDIPKETDPGVYPQGLIDYLLTEDRVFCEIIGDGTHVYNLLVEKTLRCKSTEKTIFITDSNYGAGMPAGIYKLPECGSEIKIDGTNNGVRLTERNMTLAGSALTPIDSFRNVINIFGKNISTAIDLCSAAPAKLLGLNKGFLETGFDGDILLLDDKMDIKYTIAGGEVIYKNK